MRKSTNTVYFKIRKKIIPILIGFLLLIVALVCLNTSMQLIATIRSNLDDLAYDVILRNSLLITKKDMQHNPIVIVDVDDRSLSEEGRWPWPRSKLAQLVNILKEAGATVIAFDLLFNQPEINIANQVIAEIQMRDAVLNAKTIKTLDAIVPAFDHDALFAKSLMRGDIVLGVLFHNDPQIESSGSLSPPLFPVTPSEANTLLIPEMKRYWSNITILQNAAKNGGFVNAWPDDNGVIRSIPLLLRYNHNIYGSLALEAAKLYLLIDNISIETIHVGNKKAIEFVKFGNKYIPTDSLGRVLIPYKGPTKSFPYISASDILHHTVSLEKIKNALVFIGSSSVMLGDLHPTSIDPAYPGVEIHANVTSALMNGQFLYHPSWAKGKENVITLVVGILCAFIFPLIGPIAMISFAILLVLSLFYENLWMMKYYGLVTSSIIPSVLVLSVAMTNLICGYFLEYRNKKAIKDMFSQYVPPQQVEIMSENPEHYTFEGKTKYLTVLFSDIRNFTTIAEPLKASQVKNMLNYFFTIMTEIIFRHEGTIDKYVGDMVMAFWGAPLVDKLHIKHALETALDMIQKTEDIKPEFVKLGLPEINIGIGLNTGYMYVGDMGSKYRRSYTVLGDTVNLASRLESLTKKYCVKILVSDSMHKDQDDFVFRMVDRMTVKGKHVPVTIYELVCRKKEASELLLNEIVLYTEALENFYKQHWVLAKKQLQNLLSTSCQLNPFLYQLYISRIEDVQYQSLPKDWNGVYQWQEK